MLTSLSDILRPGAVTVPDVAGKARVWKVDEARGEFVETVASGEMKQCWTVVRRRRLRYTVHHNTRSSPPPPPPPKLRQKRTT